MSKNRSAMPGVFFGSGKNKAPRFGTFLDVRWISHLISN